MLSLDQNERTSSWLETGGASQKHYEPGGEECLEGAEILAGLRFTSWAAAAPASSSGPQGKSQGKSQAGPKRAASPKALAVDEKEDSDADQSDDEEYRPSKVRVIHTGVGGSPIVLPRRSYTWRGASRRQGPQQQQQQQQQEAEGAGENAAGCEDTQHQRQQQEQQQQQPAQPAASAAGGALARRPSPEAAAPATSSLRAAPGGDDTKEGDKAWAALTTWLRMNLHNPRTAKKVVLFVGQREADTGRWAFDLNPALTWPEVSLDTKLRLRDLLAETRAAFRQKYPSRPPGDWAKKSQKYKAPGSCQTAQVPLDQLVLSLHQMYERLEGGAAPISSSGSQESNGSQESEATAGALPAACPPASPTISHNS